MDQEKVTDYLFLIKRVIDSQETLLEYQSKLESIVEMTLERDLIDYLAMKLHVYLRALSDSIGGAVSFTEDLIAALNKISTLLMNSEEPIFENGKFKGYG